jgi:hypothetical protein
LVWVSLKHKEDTFFAGNKTAHPKGQRCIIFKGKKNTRKSSIKEFAIKGSSKELAKR